jgi:hypothetical protein
MGSLIFGLLGGLGGLGALGAFPVVPKLIFGGFSIASAGPSRKYLMGGLGAFADFGVVAAA